MAILVRIVVLGLCFIGSISQASIEVVQIKGVSAQETIQAHGKYYTIVYGGLAGELSDCKIKNNQSTCNSCEGRSIKNCNKNRIFDDLLLKIDFFDTELSGKPIVKVDGHIVPIALGGTNGGFVAKGDMHRVQVTWGDICRAIRPVTSCEGQSLVGALEVGVDENGDLENDSPNETLIVYTVTPTQKTVGDCNSKDSGICSFRVRPSNGKVYFDDLESGSDFPSNGYQLFKKTRIFYSNVSFAMNKIQAVNAVQGYKDIDILLNDHGAELEENFISLAPHFLYYFRLGLIDQAGNLSHITDEKQYAENEFCNPSVFQPPVNQLLCPFTSSVY